MRKISYMFFVCWSIKQIFLFLFKGKNFPILIVLKKKNFLKVLITLRGVRVRREQEFIKRHLIGKIKEKDIIQDDSKKDVE